MKLMPAGDPGVNHLLLEFEAPPGVTLVPFCRHPEEYMIAESDAELDCSTDPKALRMRTLAGEESAPGKTAGSEKPVRKHSSKGIGHSGIYIRRVGK